MTVTLLPFINDFSEGHITLEVNSSGYSSLPGANIFESQNHELYIEEIEENYYMKGIMPLICRHDD